MNLDLYVTNDSENVINKVLTSKKSVSIKLKDTTNISNPVLILTEITGVSLLDFNYCFLSDFNRFYFIKNIEVFNKNMFRLFLECDVLESFKDNILNSYTEFKRPIKEGDFMELNTVVDVRKNITVYEFPINLIGSSLILTTMGGE